MYGDSEIYVYLQQLYTYMECQSQKINHLEHLVQELQAEVTSLKQVKPYSVERIEYKFDQLKVEKLEGTLNIGLSPYGKDMIEEFAVNGKTMEAVQVPINDQDPTLFGQIQENVHHYLNGEVTEDMQEIEHQNNYPLDDTYRQFIIEDIKKQVDQRINYYLGQLDQNFEPAQFHSRFENITNQMQKDIRTSIEAFIKNLPRKENNEL